MLRLGRLGFKKMGFDRLDFPASSSPPEAHPQKKRRRDLEAKAINVKNRIQGSVFFQESEILTTPRWVWDGLGLARIFTSQQTTFKNTYGHQEATKTLTNKTEDHKKTHHHLHRYHAVRNFMGKYSTPNCVHLFVIVCPYIEETI